METFSALLVFHWLPVDSHHKGQWREALMFSLICVWTKGWANNRGAGDLRRHRAHYNVTVMHKACFVGYLENHSWKRLFPGPSFSFTVSIINIYWRSKRFVSASVGQYNSLHIDWYNTWNKCLAEIGDQLAFCGLCWRAIRITEDSPGAHQRHGGGLAGYRFGTIRRLIRSRPRRCRACIQARGNHTR